MTDGKQLELEAKFRNEVLPKLESAPMGFSIAMECLRLASMLMDKNAAYGNSAIQPLRVFSKASVEEQILVRIDDKLSRLARGQAAG